MGPRNAVEEILAGLWREVLKIERPSVLKSFYELGGHSLLAIQLLSRIRKIFSIELPLRTLFEAPTVRKFGEKVEEARNSGRTEVVRGVVRGERKGELPLSFAQERLWFLDQLEPGGVAYNMPGGIRIKGELDVCALERTVYEIIRRHEVLRTTFGMKDGEAVQVVHKESLTKVEVKDLCGLEQEEQEKEVRRFGEEEGRQPFDLEKGPLLRVKLLKVGRTEHVLLFTMHHIVSDGWSMGIIIKEFVSLYEAYAGGKESPLKELEVQYGDYAVWQREWLKEGELEKQMGYWRKQLEGVSGALELPTDRPRPAVLSTAGSTELVQIGQSTSKGLKSLCLAESTTLFIVLSSAFKLLLYRLTGQHDLVVGTPVANRSSIEIEQLIGFFVNVLPLRTKISPAATFLNLIRSERITVLEAFSRQAIPFEKIVREVQPERSAIDQPLFQAMFTFQNMPKPPLQLRHLTISPLEIQHPFARFDLTLSMDDNNEGLAAAVTYKTALFNETTIQEMLAQFVSVLDTVVENPNIRVETLVALLKNASRAKQREQRLIARTVNAAKLKAHKQKQNAR
jgi:acyl carrier protein